MSDSIVALVRGDVTGDGIPDNIYLIGKKEGDVPFVQDIVLAVRDGRSGRLSKVPLNVGGYNPTIFLGDFSGDKIKDILIQIDSGGSGAITYDFIYSFLDNNPVKMFDFEEYNELYRYDVNYRDYYNAEVISRENRMRYLISLIYKGSAYLDELYNPNGKLIKPVTGSVDPLSSLFPVDLERDGVYEIMLFQRITGLYEADGLGYVQNILKWDNGRFKLFEQYIGINGA